MKTQKNLSRKDLNQLSCTFDSNNFSVKVNNVNEMIKTFSEVDIILIEDKKLAKQLTKLKELLNKSNEMASLINSRYYQSL